MQLEERRENAELMVKQLMTRIMQLREAGKPFDDEYVKLQEARQKRKVYAIEAATELEKSFALM